MICNLCIIRSILCNIRTILCIYRSMRNQLTQYMSSLIYMKFWNFRTLIILIILIIQTMKTTIIMKRLK